MDALSQEWQRCKGMRDMLPEDMYLFRYVEKVFSESCRKWGYKEVRTPVLEYLHLFTAAGTLTPSRLSQVYSFLDWDGWSGERVVLRPDSTIPAARLYIDNLTRLEKARLYYIQNVFSFEPTGRETREKWQCGAEFIGGRGPAADAEIILVASDILKALGIEDVKIQISHAGVIKELLNKIEPDPAKQVELFDRILDGNIDEVKLENGSGSGLDKVLNLIRNYSGQAEGFLKNLKATVSSVLPAIVPPLDDFIEVVELLSPLNGSFNLSMAAGRGFEYYTGVMVQFISGGMRIGGGGRYDDLVSLLGGPRVPACGYALYLDRLASLVKLPVIPDNEVCKVAVLAQGASRSTIGAAFTVCRLLRDAGYTAFLDVEEQETAGEAYYTVSLKEDKNRVLYLLGERGKKPVRKYYSAEKLVGELLNRGKASST